MELLARIAVVVALLGAAAAAVGDPFYQLETDIRKDVLAGYDRRVVPQPAADQAVKLGFGANLIKIEEVDFENGMLVTHMWLKQAWKDPRLNWAGSNASGTTNIKFSPDEIWMPDVVPFNNMADGYAPTHDAQVVVSNTGDVLYIPHMRVKTHCEFSLHKFPYDEHNCSIKFGSWVHDNSKLELGFYYDMAELDINEFMPHKHWELVSSSAKLTVKVYPCCPDQGYPDITFTVLLRRKPGHFMGIYMAPSIMVGILAPLAYIIPNIAGYRVALGGVLLIAQLLLLQNLETVLPQAHADMPLMVQYFLANLVIICFTTAVSCVTAALWDRGSRAVGGVHACARVLFLGCLGRLLCVGPEEYQGRPQGGATQFTQLGEEDDKVTMISGSGAAGEWRQLAAVLDRLFFIIFLVLTIIIPIGMIHSIRA